MRRTSAVSATARFCAAAALAWLVHVPQLAAQAKEHRPTTVLFLVPAFDADAQAQLREALLAQFATLGADLWFAAVAGAQGTLAQRMAQAEAAAAQRPLLAAFWIEEQADGRWFVHMMDLQSERVIVRQLEAQPERRSAAIEAVAVMVRESTRALLEGQLPPTTEDLAPIAPPPKTPLPSAGSPTEAQAAPTTPTAIPTEPAASKPKRDESARPLRLVAAYAAATFAPGFGVRHGASVGGSFVGLWPLSFGASYLITPAVSVASPVSFDVERRPVTAFVGYGIGREVLRVEGQLGIGVEWLHRTAAVAPTGTTGPTAGADTRAVVSLGPRIGGEARLLPEFGLWASAGVDIFMTNFKYIESGTPQRTLLQPSWVRPVAMVGAALYP